MTLGESFGFFSYFHFFKDGSKISRGTVILREITKENLSFRTKLHRLIEN